MGVEEKITAAAARLAARSFRLNRAEKKLVAPTVSGKNPLLPDTDDDEPNQLHKDMRETDLTIDVPSFEQGDDGKIGKITLHWDGNPVGTPFSFTTPITTFPVELTLPASETSAEGSYELSYDVNIKGNTTSSNPLVVNIDTTPPNNNRPGAVVTLPDDVERDGITREYLDANDGKVVVTISDDYSDARIDDEVILKFGTSIPLAPVVGSFRRRSLTDPITIELFERDMKQEGNNSLFYTLVDRKGNEGVHSEYKTVPVILTPAPTNLQPPQVPLADDGLIDYADAVEGVKVFIHAYTNWYANDRVVVTIDGNDHTPQQMPKDGAEINLPYALIYNGDYGLKSSRVTYRIERHGKSYEEPVGMDFDVDLRVPGPDPIDPPEGVHPKLNILTVRGAASGDNVLTEADADQDVSATAAIYPNVGDNQYAQLFWNGVKADGVRVDLDSSSTDIAFTIPWNIVKEGGNGTAIPVHYVVGHALNDNVYHAAPREVEVSGIKIVLPQPTFQHLDPSFDVLNCPSLRVHEGALYAEIFVPGGELRLADKELTFIYQGWSDKEGTVAIPGVEAKFTYTPNEGQVRDGFTVLLPYEGALEETRQLWGSIHFSMDFDGTPVSSERHLVDVEVIRPGGLACEIVRRVQR